MALIKTAAEIEKMKRSCLIAAEILKEIKKHIRPGIKTSEINEIAEDLIIKKGAAPAFKGYRGYKYSTCLSINEEVVHGLPSERRLKDGDIIGVDVGTIVDGYYGDNAETFPVGNIDAEAERLLKATREALAEGISEARDGNHLGDVSHAIEQVAKKYGFFVVKDLYGHGIGTVMHEDPLIPNYGQKGTGLMLKAGMTIAIEPMFNAGTEAIKTLEDGWTIVTTDGSLSAHFEHTILITKGRPVILTERR